MAIICYVIQHFIFIFLLSERRRKLLFSTIIFLGIFTFYTKPDTYDLISYTEAVQHPEQFEFLFKQLLLFFKYYISYDRGVIFGVQLFILLIFASAAFENKRFNIFIFVIIISSLFFTLTINNNIRQGISTILILIAFQRKIIDFKFFSYLIFSILFHNSAILFISLMMCILLWVKYIERYITLWLNYFFVITFGILVGNAVIEFISITGYENYVGKNLTVNNERTPLIIKLLIIGAPFLISEIFIGFRKINFQIDFFRYSRLFIYSTLIILSLATHFDEIGSRILFFYFGIELFLMIALGYLFIVKPLIIIMISYAFSLNAWNILGFSS